MAVELIYQNLLGYSFECHESTYAELRREAVEFLKNAYLP